MRRTKWGRLMGASRWRWLTLGLAFTLVATLIVGIIVRIPPSTFASKQQTTTYGAPDQQVTNAVNAAKWPQAESNWCGIASIAAIIQYQTPNPKITQGSIANFLDTSPAVSEWGEPPHSSGYYGPGFAADISGDYGTDPRSLTEGLTSQTKESYHQLVDSTNVTDATNHLIRDVVISKQPISVFVDHGLHSVLVSAVFATGNPLTNPGSVTALEVWDPGFGVPNANIQDARVVDVSINTWLTDSRYWGQPYQSNPDSRGIPYDPNPAIGPYAYNPSQHEYLSLWVNNYVYIRPDAASDPSSGVNADWAFDQYDTLIKGQQGQEPSSYTGPTAITPLRVINSSEFSIDGPSLWTENTYPAPNPNGPLAVLAWVGTNAAHNLNVMLSNDGLSYNSKLTLNEESNSRPSVLVTWVSGKAVVSLAWTGNNRGQWLNVLYDVYGVLGKPQKLILSTKSSPYSPSLTEFDNQLWLAWVGQDAQHTLHTMPLGPNGMTPGTDTTITSASGAGTSPTLEANLVDNDLTLIYQKSSDWSLNIVKSTDGVTWQVAANPPGQMTTNTPSELIVTSPPTGMYPIYITWTSSSHLRNVNVMKTPATSGWSGSPTVLTGGGLGGSELGYVGQPDQILVAWSDLYSRQLRFETLLV